jgi:phenylacetic acid degradation protein
MRGDLGQLIMKPGSNLQDNCIVHTSLGIDTILEEGSIVGHGVILHGCRIGRHALIGMNTVVMDRAVVGEESIVGALTVIPKWMQLPPRVMSYGIPVEVRRELTPAEIAGLARGALFYQELAARYREAVIACAPLAAPEPGRRRVIDVLKASPV